MNIYPAVKRKATQSPPPRSTSAHSMHSIKKMAVLFTDIVGSSKYFQSYGDIAGRKMLKRHQDMASSAIIEHGGSVVKMLGDSVMAYFLNPKEALKSAIKIQQIFLLYNQKKDMKDQIHIRIFIHFGKGIVEEKDIFGDVVNIAAKFLPLVHGDRICISKSVYNLVQDIPSISFTTVETALKKDILKGLTIYSVTWDEKINFDPLMKTLLYIKPAWNLGKDRFRGIWDDLLKKKAAIWAGKIVREQVFADKSIAIIVEDASSSVSFAVDVLGFIKSNLGRDGLYFLPVQIVIDTGPYLRADKLALEDLHVNWVKIDPGEIYISSSTYNSIKENTSMPVQPVPDTSQSRPFYKLVIDSNQRERQSLFSYHNVLVQGENSPCFYCGDQKHLPVDCPSKQLPETTGGLKMLGSLPLKEINSLFFNFLSGKGTNHEIVYSPGEKTGESYQWAYFGFYELKAVIQLRFFRSIWNIVGGDWNNFEENGDSDEKGGLIWIGQDCIRVSNLTQAESILGDALRKFPKDYRAYCALGFLNVEKNDLAQAKYYFKMALENARIRPHKIFSLFLLARLHNLNDDHMRAEEAIKKILRQDPYCAEAVYQDIILKFRKRKTADALHKLIRLIKNNREYFINALIDPALSNFNEFIHPELKNLFNDARDKAKIIFDRAENELQRLEKLLGKDDKEIRETETLFLKMKELLKTDSYFNYLDVIHSGEIIIKKGVKSVEERRRRLVSALIELKPRMKEYHTFVSNYPYDSLISSLKKQLKTIKRKLDYNWEIAEGDAPDRFKGALSNVKGLSDELSQVEHKLRRLQTLRKASFFIGKFFKKTLIFQSANLIIAIVLFPIIAHYLNFLMPEVKITPQNIWGYQKLVMILGGIAAFFLAILSSVKMMNE